VPPGGQACFDVTFTGSGLPAGAFDLRFTAVQSGALLGTIPVTVACIGSSTTTTSSLPTIPISTTTTSTTSTTSPRCGNGVLDPGETCDPPDPTPIPGVVPPQPTCRPDCTFCGDGIVLAGDGETCDALNHASGEVGRGIRGGGRGWGGSRGASRQLPAELHGAVLQRPGVGQEQGPGGIAHRARTRVADRARHSARPDRQDVHGPAARHLRRDH